MPTTSEAARLNLEYYRKQAKALLKAHQSGNPEADQRILAYLPQSALPSSAKISLQQAQFVVAREAGFSSWVKLKTYIEQSRMTLAKQEAEFVCAICSDNFQRAKALLETNPTIARVGIWPALAAGNVARVEAHLAANPNFAKEKGGPNVWEPLVYVSFSRAGRIAPDANAGLWRTAKLLLAHGANPNAYHVNKFWPDSPLPCLYGATAVTNQARLARVLLEEGADPNDGESLYHSIEHKDMECLKLLLEYALPTVLPPVLKHALDFEDPESVKLLLDAGADPNQPDENGENALHHAVWKGRSVRTILLLLAAGANIDTVRADGRSAYALAVCSGQIKIADFLQTQGADTSLSAQDRLLGQYFAKSRREKGQPTDQPGLLAALGEDAERLVPELAMNHLTRVVEALLDAGLSPNIPGPVDHATALHFACLNGHSDLVEVLLKHGASLTAEDDRFEGTPVGWFGQGARNSHNKEGDYVQTARLLIAAGAKFNSYQIPTGDEQVDAVFREHGLLPHETGAQK